MSIRFFFTVLLCGICSAALFAQAPCQLHSAQIAQTDVTNVGGSLIQNALIILLGMVALIVMIYIGCIAKACVDLSKPQRNTGKPFVMTLVLGLVMTAFCSSCSVAQRAMAANYRAAAAAENRGCPMNHQDDHQENTVFNNHNSYGGYSNSYSPRFCKRCGQRVFRPNY